MGWFFTHTLIFQSVHSYKVSVASGALCWRVGIVPEWHLLDGGYRVHMSYTVTLAGHLLGL